VRETARARPGPADSNDAVPIRLVRSVPHFPWSAEGRWKPHPTSLVVLLVGLWLFGTGEALLVASKLGNSPWSVLAAGVARHSPLDLGTATIVISGVVLLFWIPIGERPGLGTIANAVIVGTAVDVMGHVLPTPHALAARIALMVVGIVVVGGAGALYLSTQLGPGPRDGWMTGMAKRTGIPIARVRISIEVAVLTAGALLGGRLGVATFVFGLTIGHVLAFMLGLLSAAARPRSTRPDASGGTAYGRQMGPPGPQLRD
jgi:uncharacterized membrane protein YczE